MRIESNLQGMEVTQKEAVKCSDLRRLEPKVENSTPAGVSSLTTDGARIQFLKAAANAAPEVRSDRIASLSAAIRSGTYQAKPNQIADAMASDQLQLRTAG